MTLSERLVTVLFIVAIVTLLVVTGCNRDHGDGPGPLPTVGDCLPDPPSLTVQCLDASGLSGPRFWPRELTVGPEACERQICYLEVEGQEEPQCYYRCPPRRCP
jgi:hypothetical protein